MQTELWVGAQTDRRQWTANSLHNKRHEDESLARWMDTEAQKEWKTQKGRLRRKSKTCLRLWWYKNQGAPLKSSSGTSPGRLCYYTVNKLLYGTRYLRPGIKSVRKPGLAVSQMCRESTGAPVRSLELPATKELWSQESVSGTGKMTVRVSCGWSHWEVSITQLRPL